MTGQQLYDDVSYELSRRLTLRYSTSFGSASRMFPKAVRAHVFAIYGWVRLGDEIVDTYKGIDRAAQLRSFANQSYEALRRGYSTNPLIHAFVRTAALYGIDRELMRPFIDSMAMDIQPPNRPLTRQEYEAYIYGSAEVVGLMCLKVFVGGSEKAYEALLPGARALGSAFQKVNFLRDFADDTGQLGRNYFPEIRTRRLTEKQKLLIISDIRKDFGTALPAIEQLPKGCKRPVRIAARYYLALLKKLERTPASTISKQRVRVGDTRKAGIMIRASLPKRRSA